MFDVPDRNGTDGSVIALRLAPDDDVAVLMGDAACGARVHIDREVVTAAEAVPRGHKIALRPIAVGSPVRKYGQIIGFATAPVCTGEHVHLHNLEFRSFPRANRFGVDARPTRIVADADRLFFDGIVRSDGRVATRNYFGRAPVRELLGDRGKTDRPTLRRPGCSR